MTFDPPHQRQPARNPAAIFFCSAVAPPASSRIRTALCIAADLPSPSIDLYLTSVGGFVEDGLAIYALIRSLPIPFSVHSIESVDSIAMAIHLAGARRTASPDSSFLFHDFHFTEAAKISNRHDAAEIALRLDRARTRIELILQSRAGHSGEKVDELKLFDEPLIKSPSECEELGMVHEIQETVRPVGAELLNIEA